MSLQGHTEQLADAIVRYGATCYLLTTSDDARPHSTEVVVDIDGAGLSCALGRRTALNGLARTRVSLLWPPSEPGGYSLIVDGDITVAGAPGEDAVGTILPTRAVLHRSAPVEDAVDDVACGSDCLPIDIPSPA